MGRSERRDAWITVAILVVGPALVTAMYMDWFKAPPDEQAVPPPAPDPIVCSTLPVAPPAPAPEIPPEPPSAVIEQKEMAADRNESADEPVIFFPSNGTDDALVVGGGGGRFGGRYGGRSSVIARSGPVKSIQPEAPADMFFQSYGVNGVIDTARETQSTFAMDADTASYTVVRNYLNRGQIPPHDAVRVEEFINYFKYIDEFPEPLTFGILLEAAPSPFAKDRHLLRVALKAKDIPEKERKDLVLTFVIDVSGSMAKENRLGLVKRSLRFLIDKLRPTDRIGIVTFTSYARKVLDPTPVSQRDVILGVIEGLTPQDSTNAAEGLRLGYELADEGFDPRATNRVILCSDGVANTGDVSPESMLDTISRDAARGIYLSSLGFGMGNFNDVLLEKLADKGNGNYAYIDDFDEAKKIFSEKLVGMMEVVAADAKIQVEFDPAAVATFRLVGYENRHIDNKDFRNDKVDAGEVGAGHRVTALYEIAIKPGAEGRLVTARVRHREPDAREVLEDERSIGMPQVLKTVKDASPSYRLASAVMQFAEILRGSDYAGAVTLDQVLEAAQAASAEMERRADVVEFVELVRKAKDLKSGIR